METVVFVPLGFYASLRFVRVVLLFFCSSRRPHSTEAITNGTIPRNTHNTSNGRHHTNATPNGHNGHNNGMNGGMNGGSNGLANGHGITRGPGGLHEDIDFPPNPKTLSRRKPIVWMRPHVSGRLFLI